MMEIQDLRIGYKRGYRRHKVIAENINLSVHRGDCIALIGKNGIGKSTLLKTLSGTIAPLSGSISIQGENIQTLGALERAKVLSLVLTDKINLGHFKVRDLVRLGRYPHTGWLGGLQALDEARVEEVMALTETQAFGDKDFITLSDGEQQKVLIARALAQDTPLMILDEPGNHLDYPSRRMVFAMLRRLAHQTQKSILIATHEIDIALNYCNKLWFMHRQGTTLPKIHAGLTEDIALLEVFEEIFKPNSFTESLAPDKKRIRTTLYISVHGDEKGKAWTKKALLKQGVVVSANKPESLRVDVSYQETGHYTWTLHATEQREPRKFTSLQALIDFLPDIHL